MLRTFFLRVILIPKPCRAQCKMPRPRRRNKWKRLDTWGRAQIVAYGKAGWKPEAIRKAVGACCAELDKRQKKKCVIQHWGNICNDLVDPFSAVSGSLSHSCVFGRSWVLAACCYADCVQPGSEGGCGYKVCVDLVGAVRSALRNA